MLKPLHYNCYYTQLLFHYPIFCAQIQMLSKFPNSNIATFWDPQVPNAVTNIEHQQCQSAQILGSRLLSKCQYPTWKQLLSHLSLCCFHWYSDNNFAVLRSRSCFKMPVVAVSQLLHIISCLYVICFYLRMDYVTSLNYTPEFGRHEALVSGHVATCLLHRHHPTESDYWAAEDLGC